MTERGLKNISVFYSTFTNVFLFFFVTFYTFFNVFYFFLERFYIYGRAALVGRNVLSWWVRLGTGLRLEQQTEGQRCNNNDRTTTTFMFVVAPRRHLCVRRVSSVTAVAARRIIQ